MTLCMHKVAIKVQSKGNSGLCLLVSDAYCLLTNMLAYSFRHMTLLGRVLIHVILKLTFDITSDIP